MRASFRLGTTTREAEMMKRPLAALVVMCASYLTTGGAVYAQSAIVGCQYFDTTTGIQCGAGSRTASATNWFVAGGWNYAIAGTNSVAVGSNAWALGSQAVSVGSD